MLSSKVAFFFLFEEFLACYLVDIEWWPGTLGRKLGAGVGLQGVNGFRPGPGRARDAR